MIGVRKSGGEELREAGELLGVEAIDRTGLVVTSEGAFVRIFRVAPVNPLLMSGEEREKAAGTFGRLISQLRADERIQVVVEGRQVNLDELVGECRREVEACAGPPPSRDRGARDPLGLSRWRLHAALEESLRLHADSQAAVEVTHYVVVPFLARQHAARAAFASWRHGKLPRAPLQRTLSAHRRAVREHLGRVDALRSELEAEGMATELLDGEQVVALLWACFNPTRADGRGRSRSAGELLGELDAPAEREEAIQAGARLREAIASSSLDFDRDSQLAHVDRDAEQTIVVATTAGRTSMGWLHGAMLTRQPFTLSVYVHALERRRERQRLKLAYRRLFTINRGAESRGRVPDFDRYVQEHEYEGLLGQLASGQQTGLFHISIYETLRARGPDPDLAALSEAVDFCAEQIESAGDCKVNAGTFRQQQLWESTLPLGRDVLAQVRKYPTVNAADMLPLVGTTCGSPTGIPFAFTDPGRTVELLNLYDVQHPNHTLLIAGRSGSGRTMSANVLMSRSVALGARAFVIDRAGHYETLSRLVDGAQQIEIGAEGSAYALNPWDVPDAARVPREKIAFLIALHQVMMGRLDGQQLGMLASGIRAVYGKAAALGGSPTESLLREELRAQAEDAQSAAAPEIAATLRNLADQLSEYCGEGTYAYLLDRETTVPLDSPLVIFDTRTCPESQLQLVMFAIMEYVTGTVQRHWSAHRADAVKPGAPLFLGRSMMLIDEAWHLIRRDETGEYANDLARRARHLGLALIVMSQQLSDFNTDYGKALVRNSAQQLLLAQNPQEIPFIAETVELSERESNELGRLKTVKGRHAQMLWLNGARGHGKVTLRVGPSEYWAFTSDPTEVAIRDETIAKHDGNAWAAINTLARRAPAHTATSPENHPMTAASAEAPTRAGWVPVPEHAVNRPNRSPAVTAARLGPLLAVCGLAGGAGVSTLAYLVALAAGVSLGAGIYTTARDGLRVLATGPEFSAPSADGDVGSLPAYARAAHGLTVIDCGTLTRPAEQTAAAAATHLAWVLSATQHGVRRGERVLEAAPHMAGTELIVARNDIRQARAPLRELRRIAAERHAPLVLVPHLAGLETGNLDACAEAAGVPVQAILGALRR